MPNREKRIQELSQIVKRGGVIRRWRAIAELEELKAVEAVPTLLKVLKTARLSDLRLRTAEALGKIGSNLAVDGLLEVLANPQEMGDVRRGVIKALGEIATVEVLPTLFEIRAVGPNIDRPVATKALIKIAERLGYQSLESLEQAYSHLLSTNYSEQKETYEEETETFPSETPLDVHRLSSFRKLIRRYDSILLEDLVGVLSFRSKVELHQWLIELPDEFNIKVMNDRVIIQKKSTDEIEPLHQIDSQSCFYCGYPMENEAACPSCNALVVQCSVCKLPISFGEDIGQCASCTAIGHLKHLQEWVKTQGNCPICRQKLTMGSLITNVVSKENNLKER